MIDGFNSDEMLEYKYDDLVRETDLAWGLDMGDDDDLVWFPKSQCELNEDVDTICVPYWLAKEKGLE
jgi:hypothetical protein